jgi:predicted DNA-binding transcriptional regulator AlpA
MSAHTPATPRRPHSDPPASLLKLRDLEAHLGLSRSSIYRLRDTGRLPPPDLTIGRLPRWKPSTIAKAVEAGLQ